LESFQATDSSNTNNNDQTCNKQDKYTNNNRQKLIIKQVQIKITK